MPKQGNSAFMAPVELSAELENVVGKGPMPRTEVTKKLWEYIKKNNLQNPKNKREIIPDEKLGKVFGSSQPIDMFKMTGMVSQHFSTAAAK